MKHMQGIIGPFLFLILLSACSGNGNCQFSEEEAFEALKSIPEIAALEGPQMDGTRHELNLITSQESREGWYRFDMVQIDDRRGLSRAQQIFWYNCNSGSIRLESMNIGDTVTIPFNQWKASLYESY